MLACLELDADFSRECAGRRMGNSLFVTHPYRLQGDALSAPLSTAAAGDHNPWVLVLERWDTDRSVGCAGKKIGHCFL
jgi:hypothetical protein